MNEDWVVWSVSVGAFLLALLVGLNLFHQYNRAFNSGRLPGFSLAIVTLVWLVPFGILGTAGPFIYRKLREPAANTTGRVYQPAANDPVPLLIGGASIVILLMVWIVYRSFRDARSSPAAAAR